MNLAVKGAKTVNNFLLIARVLFIFIFPRFWLPASLFSDYRCRVYEIFKGFKYQIFRSGVFIICREAQVVS